MNLILSGFRQPKGDYAPLVTGYAVDPMSHLAIGFRLTASNQLLMADEGRRNRDGSPALFETIQPAPGKLPMVIEELRKWCHVGAAMYLDRIMPLPNGAKRVGPKTRAEFDKAGCKFDPDYYMQGTEVYDLDLRRRGTDANGRWDGFQRIIKVAGYLRDDSKVRWLKAEKYSLLGRVFVLFSSDWMIQWNLLEKLNVPMFFVPPPRSVSEKNGIKRYFDVMDFRDAFGMPLLAVMAAGMSLWTTLQIRRGVTDLDDGIDVSDARKRNCGNCAWRKSLQLDDANGVGSQSVLNMVTYGARPHVICRMDGHFIDANYSAYVQRNIAPLAENSYRGKKNDLVTWGPGNTSLGWMRDQFLMEEGYRCPHHCYGGPKVNRDTGEVSFRSPEPFPPGRFDFSFDADKDAKVIGPGFEIVAAAPLWPRYAANQQMARAAQSQSILR